MKILILMSALTVSLLAKATQVDLEAIRGKYSLPALGSALIKAGKLTSNVVGLRKMNTSALAQVDDKFHLGSCTKAMTATLLGIYVERNLIKWNATLSQLFPALTAQMHPDLRNVPLEWLPAMHSGISEDFSEEINQKIWDPHLDPRAGRNFVTQKVLSSAPEEKPGTKFLYSNASYVIAAAMLENVTGKSWETLMKEEIFNPLKMTSCGFGPQADPKIDPPSAPWPHKFVMGRLTPVTPNFFSDNPPTVGPAGTVHCSLADWAKFVQVHLDGANGKDTAILKAASFPKLHESYPGTNFTYGGWIRVETRGTYALSYVGSNTMNLADVWLFPKSNMAAMAVTNAGGGDLAATKEDPAYQAADEVIAKLIQ
jgi:CubicO group peptidase (beta-lactamase class C family)